MIDEDDDTGADRREAWERLKVYTAWAQISRAWVTTMDAKAAFISGMDGALVAFLWAGVGFAQVRGLPQWLALGSTALAGLSLWFALAVVLPRTAVSVEVAARSVGQTGAGPLSYFGFVAKAYPAGRFERFKRDAAGLDLSALADEALEQHHTISLVALEKSRGVRHSGIASIAAIAFAVVAMVARSA